MLRSWRNDRVDADKRPGAEEFLLRVIDSTESPHALDTRIEGANSLGSGEIGLVDDTDGKPTSFQWRGGISKNISTAIALGRIVTLPNG